MASGKTTEVENICKQYYLKLLEKGLPVEKVILFGSFVRNENYSGSDIDLAIILKRFIKDRFNTRLELMKAAREFDEIIEPHPFLSSEFNHSNPFADEILKTGEVVYSY